MMDGRSVSRTEALRDDARRPPPPSGPRRDPGARVAHIELARHQIFLHRLRELARPRRLVTALRGRPAFATASGQPNSSINRARPFACSSGFRSLALDVFDQRERERRLVRHRSRAPASFNPALRGAPAALAGVSNGRRRWGARAPAA
jgi:hypothetical protein